LFIDNNTFSAINKLLTPTRTAHLVKLVTIILDYLTANGIRDQFLCLQKKKTVLYGMFSTAISTVFTARAMLALQALY